LKTEKTAGTRMNDKTTARMEVRINSHNLVGKEGEKEGNYKGGKHGTTLLEAVPHLPEIKPTGAINEGG